MTKSEAGRLGGLVGHGGRPRSLTLVEIRQRQAQEKEMKEVISKLPESLSQLKRLYRRIQNGEVLVES